MKQTDQLLTKPTNRYTPEVLEDIVSSYTNKTATVEELAEKYDLPVRSIRAKLSSLGVYQKKVYVSKTGEPPVKKCEYVEKIAELMGVDIELIDSLEKANKGVLKMLIQHLS